MFNIPSVYNLIQYGVTEGVKSLQVQLPSLLSGREVHTVYSRSFQPFSPTFDSWKFYYDQLPDKNDKQNMTRKTLTVFFVSLHLKEWLKFYISIVCTKNCKLQKKKKSHHRLRGQFEDVLRPVKNNWFI